MSKIPPQHATRIEAATEGAIAEAARLLREGRLVAFPTETVYGLGASALDEAAVASVFAAKDRPRFNPLIVHFSGRSEAEEHVSFNPLARNLADAFWPGGLTLVLPRRGSSPLSLLASAGLDTVAVRSPNHPVARALLTVARIPIAAPSANRAGSVSPTTAAHVARDLYGRVDLILDAGPCPIGIESTVIGFDAGQAVLLRPGAIAREAIEDIAGRLAEPATGDVRAPGMLTSHYAPRARLRLDVHEVKPGEALLAFGPTVPSSANLICNLSPRGDLSEAAANLFAMLRQLDQSGATTIAVMRVPDKGLGEAINDRLRRAAAPREAAPEHARSDDGAPPQGRGRTGGLE
jgi:L-threonylcarbamoyladenylate synthase